MTLLNVDIGIVNSLETVLFFRNGKNNIMMDGLVTGIQIRGLEQGLHLTGMLK